MRSRLSLCLNCVLVLIVSVPAQAQVDLSSVSIRLGTIRTLQAETDDGRHLWALYPELQVGGEFFAPSLSWGFSWGYWNDGLDHTINWADHVTMSQRSHILGLRLAFEPLKAVPRWPIPLKIIFGMAEHVILDRYVGGAGVTGARLPDSTFFATTLCAGFSLAFPVSSQLQLEAEAGQFFPINPRLFGQAEEDRRNLKFGLIFTF